MHFQKIKSPKDLRNIIRNFWILELDDAPGDPLNLRIIADGSPGILYQYGENRICFDNQLKSSLSPLSLYGQTTKYGNLYASGGSKIMGVTFYPHMLKYLFGFDADEITNELTDLNLIHPDLEKKLRSAQTIRKRIAVISSYIRKLMDRRRSIDAAVHEGVFAISKTNGNLSLPKLHKTLQLSERQFERRFKRHTGIPPILFSRVVRFQSSLHQVRARQYEKLSDVAFDQGYADQSHFIREFREFSGFSPGKYRSPERDVIEICQD